MMGIRRGSEETFGEFLNRRRSDAKKVLKRTTGTLSSILLRRHWSFFGHCLRNTAVPLIGHMLDWRNDDWWLEQKALPWQWRQCHRQSGAQVQHTDQLVRNYCFANSICYAREIKELAQDR
eukprot:5268785-Karenia_brevis.AAC.1